MCEITLEIYLKKFKYSVFIIFRQTSLHSDRIGDGSAGGVEVVTHPLDASFDLAARCNCVPFALNWQEIARWHVGSHGGITVLLGDSICGARSGGWRVEMAGEVGDDICIKSQTPPAPRNMTKEDFQQAFKPRRMHRIPFRTAKLNVVGVTEYYGG